MGFLGSFDHTFKTAAAIGTTTSVWQCAILNTNGAIALATTNTEIPLGIIQRKPERDATGAATHVRLGAITKAQVGSDSIGTGDLLWVTGGAIVKASGQTFTGTANTPITKYTIGMSLERAAHTGAVIAMLFRPEAWTIEGHSTAAGSITMTIPSPA